MTITATTTDSTSRRRHEEAGGPTTAETASASAPRPDAAAAQKAGRSREHAEPLWTHTPDAANASARVDLSKTFAKARNEIKEPLPKSLCPANGVEAQKQMQADLKEMLPKLVKLEKDLAALSKAMHPYMKDVEEGLHAAHEMKEGVEAMLEGEHMAHHAGIGEQILASTAIAVGITTFVHGAKHYAEVIERLPPDAKTTVAAAKPIMQEVTRDLADVAITAKAMLDHGLRGGLTPQRVCIGG